MRPVLLLSATFLTGALGQLLGQTYEAAPPRGGSSLFGAQPFAAAVRPTDKAFPHLAMGAGWETILVLVNMGSRPITFNQDFWDQQGRPVQVRFRSIPGGVLTTTSSAVGTLPPNSSFNVLLFDSGQPLQVAWSSLDYDSTNDRLGGFAIFRNRVEGRPDFEALVPLSSIDDFKFYLPFDNLEGFVTSMAVLNPGASSTQVTISARSTTGQLLAVSRETLPGGNQMAFVLHDKIPETRNRAGTLLVEGTTSRLSGLGFRFNSGGAFATIPIMNWAGMF
jgi:hypothetical protein